MKFSMRSVAAAALVAFGGSSAMAALSVGSAIPGGPVLFSDNSAEYLVDRNGNGLLDVGDSLRGIFRIESIEALGGGSSTQIGQGTAYNELTAIFQTVVTSKVAVGGGRFNYTFGYDALSGFGAGVLAQLYEDAAQDYARIGCANFAACEATAMGGSLWAELGTGSGTFWSALNTPDNPGVGATLPATTPLGAFSVGLDFITNNTGFQWNQVACVDQTDFSVSFVDVCGQGGLLASGRLASGTDTPYDVFNNVDFTANRVPEPGSLALVALGLLGVGAVSRKRKV